MTVRGFDTSLTSFVITQPPCQQSKVIEYPEPCLRCKVIEQFRVLPTLQGHRVVPSLTYAARSSSFSGRFNTLTDIKFLSPRKNIQKSVDTLRPEKYRDDRKLLYNNSTQTFVPPPHNLLLLVKSLSFPAKVPARTAETLAVVRECSSFACESPNGNTEGPAVPAEYISCEYAAHPIMTETRPGLKESLPCACASLPGSAEGSAIPAETFSGASYHSKFAKNVLFSHYLKRKRSTVCRRYSFYVAEGLCELSN